MTVTSRNSLSSLVDVSHGVDPVPFQRGRVVDFDLDPLNPVPSGQR